MIKKLLLIALGAFIFCSGGFVEQATFEPQVITETKIEYRVEEVTVTEIVEVEKSLRHFNSLSELEEWLAPFIVWANDCDDFALSLQKIASRDGYILDFEIIYPGEYNRLFKEMKLGVNVVHAVNLAIIGNEVYYIEPQTREVVFVINLD